MTDLAEFLANLRSIHTTNAELLDKQDERIAALQNRFDDDMSTLQIDRAAIKAAFETSGGILAQAEKLSGFTPPAGATHATVVHANGGGGGSAAETIRAKRGEILGLILGLLRAVPIAGMTEANIISALAQHKAGSVAAALKNAVVKAEIEQKDGKFFAPIPQPAPQPIAAPVASASSPAIGEPDALCERNIVNAIKTGPKSLDALLDRCEGLGSTSDIAKATVEDMVVRKMIERAPSGLYDFASPVGAGASA